MNDGYILDNSDSVGFGFSRRKPQNRLPTPRSTGRSRGDLVLVQFVLCIMLAVFPLLSLLGMGCLILPGGFDDLLEMFGALGPGERRGVLTVLLEVSNQKLHVPWRSRITCAGIGR